jgi:hypothetical protein
VFFFKKSIVISQIIATFAFQTDEKLSKESGNIGFIKNNNTKRIGLKYKILFVNTQIVHNKLGTEKLL